MTDTNSDSAPAKNAGSDAKPRLSLLNYPRRMRVPSSDDIPNKPLASMNVTTKDDDRTTESDQQTDDHSKILERPKHSYATKKSKSGLIKGETPEASHHRQVSQEEEFSRLHQQVVRFGQQSSFTVEDLFRIMAVLKSDIQTKEMALNSFKTEQLKRLMNPIEIKKSTLADAYIEIQDRLSKGNNPSGNTKPKQRSSSASEGTDLSNTNSTTENIINESNRKQMSLDQAKEATASCGDAQEAEIFDREDENLKMMMALLELLDRHPLLALPRDAMYCLDYACNDISTKNYLNLKIQGLENLIDQHRRFRFYISERLKRSEQRYMDLALSIELERKLKMGNERAGYISGGKAVLLNQINQLKDALEREKASKHTIVMTLLNELLDEKEKNDLLETKVKELEKRLAENKSVVTKQVATTVVASKPRVPAKPAQLLDRQRSQTSTTK